MSEELKRGIPKATVIGRVEYTAEEEALHRSECEAILKKMGVLKDGESVKDYEVANS